MSHKSTTTTSQTSKATSKINSQVVFKYISLMCLMIIVLSAPGIFHFRQYCKDRGYKVSSLQGLTMVGIGFVIYFIAKYSYYYCAESCLEKLVNKKYEGQNRKRKVNHLLKVSFDTIFYTFLTSYSFFQFRREDWFSQMVGGEGKCSNIYQQYPDWPENKRYELENYFCFQLGIHIFSLIELFTVRRKTQHKFYEWTLHHLVTVTLIFFSFMCNEIIIGIMILFVHDISDVFLSSGRFFSDATLPKYIKNSFTEVLILAEVFITWIYFRLIVYPYCMITQIFNNIPNNNDEWSIIYLEYCVLLVFCIILVFMHAYWLLYLFKAVLAIIKKDNEVNKFDNQRKLK